MSSIVRDKASEMSSQARDALDREEYDQAFQLFINAQKIDDGYDGAEDDLSNIGYLIQNGYGVRKNEQEAVKWYEKASRKGSLFGLNNLAICYYYGNGVEIDYNKAYKTYRQLAEDTDPSSDAEWGFVYQAQYMLGYMSENGEGVDPCMEDALYWYSLAAENEHETAESRLKEWEEYLMEGLVEAANYFYEGKEAEKDYETAFSLYKRVSENCSANNDTEKSDLAYAQYSLGLMFEHGHGTEVDKATAKSWYIKSANNGSELSKKRLKEVKL